MAQEQRSEWWCGPLRHLLAVAVQNAGLPVNLTFPPLIGTPFLNTYHPYFKRREIGPRRHGTCVLNQKVYEWPSRCPCFPNQNSFLQTMLSPQTQQPGEVSVFLFLHFPLSCTEQSKRPSFSEQPPQMGVAVAAPTDSFTAKLRTWAPFFRSH